MLETEGLMLEINVKRSDITASGNIIKAGNAILRHRILIAANSGLKLKSWTDLLQ